MPTGQPTTRPTNYPALPMMLRLNRSQCPSPRSPARQGGAIEQITTCYRHYSVLTQPGKANNQALPHHQGQQTTTHRSNDLNQLSNSLSADGHRKHFYMSAAPPRLHPGRPPGEAQARLPRHNSMPKPTTDQA